tara:strand:- start:1124 stop:1789 length:666 start_codon:yes stop_codon:yes gene_type:complete
MAKIKVFPYETDTEEFDSKQRKVYKVFGKTLTVSRVLQPEDMGTWRKHHRVIFDGDKQNQEWTYAFWDKGRKVFLDHPGEIPVEGQTYKFNLSVVDKGNNDEKYPYYLNVNKFESTDQIADVIQAAKDFEEKPTVTPPAPVQNSDKTVDQKIKMGMAFNNFSTILGSGLIGKHFGDEVEKEWLIEWKHQYDKAKNGEEIYTDEHPLDTGWDTDDDEEVETI